MRTATAHINCLLICVAACTANAHDGPHDVIAQLNQKIEAEGGSVLDLPAFRDDRKRGGATKTRKNKRKKRK